MTTPLIMLALMIVPWVARRTQAAAAVELGLLFLFTGAGHLRIFDRFGAYAWLYIGSFVLGLGAVAIALAFPPIARRPA